MLLKTIKIKNFFNFIEESIVLKNGVNIICADNNFGKSAIFGAIKWCFKGGKIFKEKYTHTKSKTFNEISLMKNESEMSVEIKFNHENSEFLLIRKSMIKSSAKRETLQDTDFEDEVSLYKNSQGVSQNQINEEIEKILPDYAIRTFFFDGEGMDVIADDILNIEGQEKKLLTKLQDTIGIPFYEDISSISDKITNNYYKQKLTIQKRSGIEDATAKATDDIRKEIEQINESLFNLKNHILKYDEEIKNLDKEIEKFIKQKGFHGQKVFLQTQLDGHFQDKANFISDNYTIISNDNFWESILNDFLNKNYDQSKKSKNQLHKELDYLKNIERVISEKCKGEIKKLIDEVNYKINESKDDSLIISDWENTNMINKYNGNVKFIKKTNLEISKTEKKLEELKKELEGFDNEKYSKMVEEHKASIKFRTIAQKDYDDNLEKLEEKKFREKELRKKADEQVSSTKELSELKRKIELSKEIEDLFKKAKFQHLESIKKDLQKNSQEIYKKITREDDYKSGGLELTDAWQVNIVDKKNNKIKLKGQSAGTRCAVALSILAGLSQAIDKDKPFIGDSIFMRLDPPHKKNILDQHHKFGTQMILFLTGAEHADLGLNPNHTKWNTLKLVRVSRQKSEIESANLIELDEERRKIMAGE